MRILALDLGTNTGWALSDRGEITSGTWKLLTDKERDKQKKDGLDRCCDVRFARLKEKILACWPLDVVVFEDVQFLSTQLQAQLWAGLRTVVVLHFPQVRVLCLPVGTLKKFATGSGNATKEMMLAALVQKYPGRFRWGSHKGKNVPVKLPPPPLDPEPVINLLRVDDNEADAFHLLMWATKEVTKP